MEAQAVDSLEGKAVALSEVFQLGGSGHVRREIALEPVLRLQYGGAGALGPADHDQHRRKRRGYRPQHPPHALSIWLDGSSQGEAFASLECSRDMRAQDEHRVDIALALLATASIAGIVWIGRA